MFGLGTLGTAGRLLGRVHGLAQLHGGVHQGLGLGLDVVGVVPVLHRLQVGQSRLDGGLVGGADLVTELRHRLFGGVDQAVRMVAGLHHGLALLVLGGIGLGLADHGLDVGVGQAAIGLDADRVLLVGGLVLGLDIDDAVGVDVEGHLHLGHTPGGRGDADQVELAQELVVVGHRPLTLEHPDGHGGLVVLGGGEGLAALGRDGGVALDQRGEHAAQGLDAERQRGHVQQQDVLHIPLQHATLHRGTQRHDFVRVHALVRLAAEEGLNRLHHLGHAGHAAHQNHFIDLRLGEARVLQRLLAGADGALDQVLDQAFQLGAGQLHVQVQRAGRVHGDEGQVHLVLGDGGQFLLGLLGLFLQALQGQLVLAQVDAGFLLELVGQEVDHAHVEVLAAEEGVAIGGLHLEHAVADLEDRHVEGPAAQVIDGDLLAVGLVEAVGQRRRRGLVDDAQDFEAGDLAGVLGGLALGVVEIGGHRDHRLGDGLAQMGLGGLLHLHQGEGGDLLRRIVLAVGADPGVAVRALDDLVGHHVLVLGHHLVVILSADQALDGEEGVGGIGHRLALGRLAHQALRIVQDGDDGGGGARAFGVLDDLGGLAVHDGHARIGGAEVNPDDLAHVRVSLQSLAVGLAGLASEAPANVQPRG